MKERPVLMNAERVRAILDGRKTQTRRVVKPQPSKGADPKRAVIGQTVWNQFTNGYDSFPACPYGIPGDRLWVRETWQAIRRNGTNEDGGDEWWQPIDSPVTVRPPECVLIYRATDEIEQEDEMSWRPSIHMPRWASRITLEVTGVRVERLQDISEEDARAEGCSTMRIDPYTGFMTKFKAGEIFPELWDSINAAPYAWADNPFVWIVEFRKVTP